MVLVSALVLVACGTDSTEELVVSAASSLTDAFARMEEAFEKANPGVDVILNHAGSATLREQILEGAPVDVFAPADPGHMRQVAESGEVAGEPSVFATNHLQIAVPAGNPGGVRGLEDFAEDGLLLGLCDRGVPCGDLARSVLDAAGINAEIDTAEPNARLLLAKIEAGELDAGIVYVTDVRSAEGRIQGIELPSRSNRAAEYEIATLARSDAPELSAAFVEFVLSEEGQAILADAGFGAP